MLSLAILVSRAPKNQIARIVGAWAALSSIAACVAPLLGGLLVEAAGWRWLFAINIGPLIIMIWLAWKKLPGDHSRTRTGIDVVGTGLLVASIFAVSTGLSLSVTRSLSSPYVIGPILVGFLLLALFVYQQRQTRHPMTDWSVIGARPIPLVMLLLAASTMAITGAMFQQTLLIQDAFAFSPLLAGFIDVAPAVVFIGAAAFSARVSHRFGLAQTVAGGLAISAVGLLGIGVIDRDESPLQLVVWSLFLGLGMGISVPSLNSAAIRRVTKESLGAVSGFLSLASQLAAVIGIGLFGGIAAASTRTQWMTIEPQGQSPDLVTKVISGSISVINEQYGLGTATAASSAYTKGVILSVIVSGIGLLVAALFALIFLSRRWISDDD